MTTRHQTARPAAPPRRTLSYNDVTRTIARTLGSPGRGYYILLSIAVALLAFGVVCLLFLLRYGLGLAGYMMPTYWAVYITCFVFWVGIAHSGTLISAILFLFRSGWRTAVYRVAEIMTVFAVMTAGLFPLIHIGRQWFFYWLIPYPNERGLWPNFKSPLVWDAVRGGHLLHRVHVLSHYGSDSRHRCDPRCCHRVEEEALHPDRARVARDERAVAALPTCVPVSRSAGHTPCALGTQRGVVGLRHVAGPGLA